jgi:hypothetical protein
MADNIGGFKINGTVVAGPRLASGGGLTPVLGTPSTEILNPAVAGSYTLWLQKLSFVVANIR